MASDWNYLFPPTSGADGYLDTPVSPEQYDKEVVTDPLDGVTFTKLKPKLGVTKSRIFEIWHVCPLCAMSFPESEMLKIEGTWYSTKNGCTEEVLGAKLKDVGLGGTV